MRSNLIEIEVLQLHETEKAALVTLQDLDKGVWLPKSAIEIEPSGGAGIWTLTIPEPLALEKGLI